VRLARRPILLLAAAVLSACRSPASPAATAATVDVLPYLLGDASLWPRRGNHGQDQIVDPARREVCWIKYGNPRRFECWRWDDQFIYHAVDHGLDGDSNESYRFSDGRWLARFLPLNATAAAPWTIDVTQNQQVWFDGSCRIVPSQSHAFPYRQRAWFEPRRDAGGDLGTRDTLVLEYQAYDPAGATGAAEHFYFGRGAGWYEWERSGFRDVFNRRWDFRVVMDRGVWCGAPP
jgi:hypothetical protein